jgi:hypothetical protein
MQTIPLSLAAAGMVLSKDVRSSDDPSSMTLCGKGVTLTDSLIDRLQQKGVQSVSVEGHPVHVEGEATLEQMLAALDLRFSRVEQDELMKKIKTLFRNHIVRSMGEPGGR